MDSIKEEHLLKKGMQSGKYTLNLFPCIVRVRDHIAVAYHKGKSKNCLYSYTQLAEAFYAAVNRKEEDIMPVIVNTENIKAQKRVNKEKRKAILRTTKATGA